ncbi:hypothetical protein E2C01_098597 [Portunus trituberculatus]|uniref:Uncharacterized protein n=1 Tax=Portunus trituberculatus TaxID=210409 RepID=A0A5B7K8N4_PORTR|nr:hypothetical protein [Portunus trituberculatus]
MEILAITSESNTTCLYRCHKIKKERKDPRLPRSLLQPAPRPSGNPEYWKLFSNGKVIGGRVFLPPLGAWLECCLILSVM